MNNAVGFKAARTNSNRTPDRLLSTKQVVECIGFSRVYIWRLVKENRFPAPIKIGKTRNAWRESEIQGWIDEQDRLSRG